MLCGLSCLHLSRRTNSSTILEGQMLGTVHIMEGTCSRLGFFVRNIHIYIYIFIQIHIHVHLHVHIQIQIHVHSHVRVRVCLCFFVVWCRWWWSGVCGVWCGVNGEKVAEEIV